MLRNMCEKRAFEIKRGISAWEAVAKKETLDNIVKECEDITA